MSKRYSSKQVTSAIRSAGLEQVSRRGSHVKRRMTRNGQSLTVIVKHPAAKIPAGTFRSILRQAGLTLNEFEQFLA